MELRTVPLSVGWFLSHNKKTGEQGESLNSLCSPVFLKGTTFRAKDHSLPSVCQQLFASLFFKTRSNTSNVTVTDTITLMKSDTGSV